MAETTFRGPAYSAGAMYDGRIESMDGPGIEYQANCFPDLRYFPTRKDGMYPGRVPAFLNSPFAVLVDNIPTTLGTAVVVALQNVASGTAMTFVTVAAGTATAGNPSHAIVPVVPFGKGAGSVVNAFALDFGFTSGTITAGSTTVTVPDSTLFTPGEWICIGGAGNSAKTASLFTQVLALASATTITVSIASQAALTGAPIGRTNLTMGALAPPQAYPPNLGATVPSGAFPYTTAGLASLFNPQEGLARAISITGVAGGAGGTFIVRSLDVFGFAMSENIVVAAGANTVSGKKAHKYILSVTPQFTDAHNYSVGTLDIYGFNLRSDKWEYANVFVNGAFITVSTGWTAAVATNPATATTGDVRGTYALQTPANGTTNRLAMFVTVPLAADILATPQNPVPLYGVTQFTQ